MANKKQIKVGSIVVIKNYKNGGDIPGTITKVKKINYLGDQIMYYQCYTDYFKKHEINTRRVFYYTNNIRLAKPKEIEVYKKRKKGTMTVLSLPSANITSKGNKIKSDNKNVKVKRTGVGCYEVKARIPAI